MNLATLRTRVFGLIAENAAEPQHVSAAMVDESINDAYREFAMISGALEIRHGVSAVAGQAEYALPDSVSRVFRVGYDGYALVPTSQRELDDLDPNHRTLRGTPDQWTKDRMDERRLRFYPIPTVGGPGMTLDGELGELTHITGGATISLDNELGVVTSMTVNGRPVRFTSEFGVLIDLDFSTNDFDVWAKKTPPLLSADDDEPEIPGYAHLGLAYSAAARVLLARTELRNEALAATFEGFAQDYATHLTRISNHRTPERVDRTQPVAGMRGWRNWRPTAIPIPVGG